MSANIENISIASKIPKVTPIRSILSEKFKHNAYKPVSRL